MNTKERKALTFLIKKGPSRDKLLDGFKYAYDTGVTLPIGLYVEVDKKDPSTHDLKTVEIGNLIINDISHIDNSGQAFDLKGYCNCRFNEVGSFEFYKFESNYDARSRLGTITLFIPD